jgi:hypothetical protein
LREKNSQDDEYHPWELPSFSFGFLKKSELQQGIDLAIPEEVSVLLEDFERRFQLHSAKALWFTAHYEEARELLASNPFLVWAIIEHSEKHQLSPEEVQVLFSTKRKEILNLVGISGSKSQLKTLNKIHFDRFTKQDLYYLRLFLNQFDARFVARFASLSMNLLRELLRFPDLAQQAFLHNLSLEEHDRVYGIVRDYHDTRNMLVQVGHAQPRRRLSQCATPTDLRELHDELIEQINEISFKDKENYQYPKAPAEDSETFRHINDFKTLSEEGRSQKHCIASYNQRILRGEYLALQYLGEERATIGLKRTERGWVIDQVRLKRNLHPSQATMDEIYAWLSNLN